MTGRGVLTNRSNLAPLSVLLLCGAIVFAFAPGHMDADILGMLRWAKFGGYTDWYPLLLPLFAKVCVVLGIGPGAILAFQVFAVGSCTYAFMAFFWRPLTAAICTYFVLLCPAILGYLGAITSHGLMVTFLVAGYTGLLRLTKPSTSRRRVALFALTFAALALATVSRQNAPTFTLPAFYCWFFLLTRHLRAFESRKFVRAGLLFVASCVTVSVSATIGKAALETIFSPLHAEPSEYILLYDTSAISLRAHRLFLDKKHFPSQNLANLQKIFYPYNSDILIIWGHDGIPPLKLYSDPVDRAELMRTWRGCIAMYPAYYLTERYHLFRGLMGLNFHGPPDVPFHPDIDTNKLGYHLEDPVADAAAVGYLKEFQTTFVDRAFVYFILVLFAVGIGLFRIPQPATVRLVLLSIVCGSFFNAAGYFFATPSTLLRYIWPSIVANGIVTAALAPYCLRLLMRQIDTHQKLTTPAGFATAGTLDESAHNR